jgi:hypothetical protein
MLLPRDHFVLDILIILYFRYLPICTMPYHQIIISELIIISLCWPLDHWFKPHIFTGICYVKEPNISLSPFHTFVRYHRIFTLTYIFSATKYVLLSTLHAFLCHNIWTKICISPFTSLGQCHHNLFCAFFFYLACRICDAQTHRQVQFWFR